jgi:DNA-binding response OmpR family regulator
VLLAKINALLRRVYSYNDKSLALEARGALLGGDGMLALHGAKIELTKNEYRILKMLLENKNTIVSRETIMRALWDSESFIDDNTLTVNVNRLRKKLEQAGLADFIATKKGEGYMVCD